MKYDNRRKLERNLAILERVEAEGKKPMEIRTNYEAIGKPYGITRQRVRDIVKSMRRRRELEKMLADEVSP